MTDTTDTREIVDFPHDDVIDTRDLLDKDFGDEINAELADAENYSEDWRHGETLIAQAHMPTYAYDLADDIGAINTDAGWPLSCIDWERAARELAVDYTLVRIDGRDYYIR